MKKIFTLLFTLCLFIIPTSALAKGPFSYITIKGPDVSGDLSVTDPAMLDYFAFADFSKGGMDAPANPGDEYEVVRSFVDPETNKVQNWDMLHYYPDTGYVYYDGLINGSSEYDGKWYQARPNINAEFSSALSKNAFLEYLPRTMLVLLLIFGSIAYFRKTSSKPS